MKYDGSNLEEVLRDHELWISTKEMGGSCADFDYADLSGKVLVGKCLSNASFEHANLEDADFSESILNGASFEHANLWNAKFYAANLYYSNFRFTDINDTSFEASVLHGANFSYAYGIRTNFARAYMRNCDIKSAKLIDPRLFTAYDVPYIPYVCPDTGSFIGYKRAWSDKLWGSCIVKLQILNDSKRLSAGFSRKCRCDKAKVLEIQSLDGKKLDIKKVYSSYDLNFIYKVGKIVEADSFDENRWNTCSNGIHFYIDRQEAVNHH